MIAKLVTFRPDPIDIHDAPSGWYEVSQGSQGSASYNGEHYYGHRDGDIILVCNGCVANITKNFNETLAQLKQRGRGVTMVLPLGMTLSKLELHMDSLATNPRTLSAMQIQAATPPPHSRGFDMPLGTP